jgi:cystathionine beta-synthase
VLALKSGRGLITASVDDPITDVIALMKANDISQVPALDGQGKLAGLVTEVDLLKYMLDGGPDHSPDERISAIVQEAEAVYPADTLLEDVLPEIVEGFVVFVTEADQPVGILTKIDVLDYVAKRG